MSNSKQRFLALIVFGTALFLIAPSVHAQPPGSWTKVAIGQYAPMDFSFSDSVHGLLLAARIDTIGSKLVFFETTDGGRSWKQGRGSHDSPSVDLDDAYEDVFQSPTSRYGFLTDDIGEELDILNDSLTFRAGWDKLRYHTCGQKMYDSASGVRFICRFDTAGQLTSHSLAIVTHDGWKTSDSLHDILNMWTEYATIHDSDNIWTAHENKVLHYYGTPALWHTVYPADPTVLVNWGRLEFGMSGSEGKQDIYALGYIFNQNNNWVGNFAYSENGGASWKLDSTFSGRLEDLAATTTGVVWCFAGNGGGLLHGNYRQYQSFHDYADTLYYSSNHGRTWSIDSSTFAGAMVMQMHWVDPRHGFVSTMEFADTCFMYRYEAPTLGVAINAIPSYSEIKMLTSPASQHVSFTASGFEGPTTFRIFDLLGRERRSGRILQSGSVNKIELDGMAAGYYTLSISDRLHTISKGFMKE